MSSSRRLDNVSVAAEAPGGSPHTCVGSGTICEPLSDHEWVQEKYNNFRGCVRSLVVQEPKLEEWHLWLDTIPLAIFLAGGDGELRGVREATTDEQRFAEAGQVLERWALLYSFTLSKITAADIVRLTRYVLLFSAC